MVDIGMYYTTLLWKSEHSKLPMNVARIFKTRIIIWSVNLKEKSRFEYIALIFILTSECILEKYYVKFRIELA